MVVGAVVPYQHAEGHGKATGNVDRRDRNGDGAEHSCGGEATLGDFRVGSYDFGYDVFTLESLSYDFITGPALAAPEVLALDLVHASDDDDACARAPQSGSRPLRCGWQRRCAPDMAFERDMSGVCSEGLTLSTRQ